MADYNQYSTIKPLTQANLGNNWLNDEDRDRIAAYQKYEEIYWNNAGAFQLMRRGAELQPIYIPNAMVVCDETAHFLLKGINFEMDAGKKKATLDPFLKREKFQSRFAVAKHAGVVRGDWVMHMTANKDEPEGKRISLVSVDPARYFPVFDDEDWEKRIGAHLAEAFMDPKDKKLKIRRLTYRLDNVGGKQRVLVEEAIFAADEDWNGLETQPLQIITPERLLPEGIEEIPLYHYKNRDWDGDIFGSSEIRGFERLMAGVDQTVSDTELALALEGLGVYATDGGAPVDNQGNQTPWEIAPGRVMEVPTGSYFKRVEGIKQIEPVMTFLQYIEKKQFQGAHTFDASSVDVATASSDISLQIKFLPTQAKMEERNWGGLDVINNMFFEWAHWMDVFEDTNIGSTDIVATLGDLLPLNRQERFAELNNMLDREVISREYYRQEAEKLGYTFPDDITDQIEEELKDLAEWKLSGTLPEPQAGGVDAQGNPIPASGNPDNPNEPTATLPKKSGSNNKGRPNESRGTEQRQTSAAQQRTRPRGRNGGR